MIKTVPLGVFASRKAVSVAAPLEPIRKLLQSDESDVIMGWPAPLSAIGI
jgi:hypothetical protein